MHTTQVDKSKIDSNSPSSSPEAGVLPDATSFSQLHATDPKNLSFCITQLAPDAIGGSRFGDMAAR